MPTILLVDRFHDAGFALLRARADVEVLSLPEPEPRALRAALARADGLAVRTTKVTAAVVQAAPHLRVVARHGVGYDSVDVAALTARGIPLTITVEANCVSVAEQALHLMLAVSKQALAYDAATRAGRFGVRSERTAVELYGKTVLVVGFGRIGARVARRCAAFEMNVLVYDPLVPPAAARAHGYTVAEDLGAALTRADFVTLHTPLSDATRGLIGAAELAAMRPTAILVNTARGGVVDEAALAAALREGRLRGAGLDVFVDEPTKPDNPLLGLDNVVLSPHSAALTEEAAVRMARDSVQHVLDALDGTLDPACVVNPEVLNARC